jgi:hypothetical protein
VTKKHVRDMFAIMSTVAPAATAIARFGPSDPRSARQAGKFHDTVNFVNFTSSARGPFGAGSAL